MSTKRILFLVVVISLAALAIGLGLQPVQAVSSAQAGDSIGATIPYLGQLTDEAGQPVADGAYDLSFALYAEETARTTLWAETQIGVQVRRSSFSVMLGSVNAIPQVALEGDRHWLEVAVRGPGDKDFTALAPRQRVSTTSPSAPAAGPTCAHDHFGEHWTGDSGALGNGLRVENTYTSGIGLTGVAHNGTNAYGVLGWTTVGTGVKGQSTTGTGVYAVSDSGTGLSANGDTGVFAVGTTNGVSALSSSGTAVAGLSGHYAVYAVGTGGTHANAALRSDNLNTTDGIAAYFTNQSGFPTLELDQSGSGRVMDLQNGGDAGGAGGGDFIAGYSKDSSFDLQFRITSSGQGRSDVGWTTPAEDFAELLPAVAGLEPGDVLVIDLDGTLARSTEAYQASVAGVYSTQPGFLGGQPVEGEVSGTIPLAVVGVVPVKVSAENGAIHPGDLLVTSATPGYAMKAGSNPPQGTVIGKALEPLNVGTSLIKMLATLQ